MTTASARMPNLTLPDTWLDDAPEFDPYAAFDKATGSGQMDPYPIYTQYRQQGGVIRHVPRDMIAEAVAAANGEVRMAPEFEVWSEGDAETPASYGLYSYEVVNEALKNNTAFTSTGYANLMGQVFGHSILEMDPPEHTQHRGLVAQAFRPKVLAMWESGIGACQKIAGFIVGVGRYAGVAAGRLFQIAQTVNRVDRVAATAIGHFGQLILAVVLEKSRVAIDLGPVDP